MGQMVILNKQQITMRRVAGTYSLSYLLLAILVTAPLQLQAENGSYWSSDKNPSKYGTGRPYTSIKKRGKGKSTPTIIVSSAKQGAHVVLGGTVKAFREVTLSAQAAGRIEFIAGSEGDWFDEGQVLVAIGDDGVLAQRQQAMADLYGRTSSLQNERAKYSREFWAPQALQQQTAPSMGYFPSMFEKFMGFGGGPGTGGGLNPWVVRDVDLYSQGTHVNRAQSGILGARSRVDEIDARIRDTRSISPFEGVVIKKLAEIGDTVQPGQALLKFADTRYLQLKVDVPARLVAALSEGMVVSAKLDVGDTYINVRVAQIFPVADSLRHTVTVKFDLPQDAPGGPGMYAEVMIPDVNTPVIDMPVIPSSAIVRRGSLPAVFVLNHEGRAEMRLIRLGDEVDNENVAVLSGVYPGEEIFVRPPLGIKSGWSPDSSK